MTTYEFCSIFGDVIAEVVAENLETAEEWFRTTYPLGHFAYVSLS